MPYFTSLLSTTELARAKRYHTRNDQHRFVVSRGLVRTILGRYTSEEPARLTFSAGRNNKPLLADKADLQYNLAHSKDYIILAVSGTEVGIDIEKIDASFCFQDVLSQCLSLPEQAAIAQQEDVHRTLFYQSWTRKEAFVKATGEGITANFQQVPSLDGQHSLLGSTFNSSQEWLVSSFRVAPDYSAAVAYPSDELRPLRFYQVPPAWWDYSL